MTFCNLESFSGFSMCVCVCVKRLKDEGQNGWAQGRVFLKLLQVAAVFGSRPHGHLHKADDGEEGDGNALSHHRKAYPGACLRGKHTTPRHVVFNGEGDVQYMCNDKKCTIALDTCETQFPCEVNNNKSVKDRHVSHRVYWEKERRGVAGC